MKVNVYITAANVFVMVFGISEAGKLSSLTVFFICVLCRLDFSWFRCPYAVFGEGGIFAIRLSVSPGQDIKLPFFIARINVLFEGLKQHACKYCANSVLVVCFVDNYIQFLIYFVDDTFFFDMFELRLFKLLLFEENCI